MLSFVIPTIEEEAVFDLVNRIKKEFPNSEIIIVDKSSKEYRDRLKKLGVKILVQKNFGVENAIMLGFRKARGDILITIDGDDTHDREFNGIKKAIEMINNNEADVVFGNRFGGIKPGAMPFYIYFGNKVISRIFSFVYHIKLHDSLTGLVVMKREAFDSIRNLEPYRAGLAFFAIEFAKRGYIIKEVPITYYPRRFSQSKLAKSKTIYGFGVVAHIVRMARDYNPLFVFGTIGVILIIIGFLIGLYVLLNFLSTGSFTLIGRALIAFMLVVLGFLSIIAGFILDLLIEIERRLE